MLSNISDHDLQLSDAVFVTFPLPGLPRMTGEVEESDGRLTS